MVARTQTQVFSLTSHSALPGLSLWGAAHPFYTVLLSNPGVRAGWGPEVWEGGVYSGKPVATCILKLALSFQLFLIWSKNMKRLATPSHVNPMTASNTTTKGKDSVYLSTGNFFKKKNTSGTRSHWVINELSPHQRKKITIIIKIMAPYSLIN